MQICDTCETMKESCYFENAKKNKNGLRKTCKDCQMKKGEALLNEYLATNQIYIKVCNRCNQAKPHTEYNRFYAGKYSLTSFCKKCSCEKSAYYKIKNKENNKSRRSEFLICKTCKKEKLTSNNFTKNKATTTGYELSCIECRKNTDKIIVDSKQCCECKEIKKSFEFFKRNYSVDKLANYCKKCSKRRNRKYYNSNKETISIKRKEYNLKNKEKINLRRRIKSKEDNNFKIRMALSRQLYTALKRINSIKNKSIIKIIDIPIPQIKEYIESLFENGMTWENYGNDGWEIDHIVPSCAYNLIKQEEQKKCFHHLNLRPCWAETEIAKKSGSKNIGNSNKGNKIIPELLINHIKHNLIPENELIGYELLDGEKILSKEQLMNLILRENK